MENVQVCPRSLRAGQNITIETKKGGTIIGTVEANNTLAELVEFEDGFTVPYRAIVKATAKADPRWEKTGIYVYYTYGLDSDGHMTTFPNLVMKTRDNGWWLIGNAGGLHEKIPLSEVPFSTTLPLTIHPDYVGGQA